MKSIWFKSNVLLLRQTTTRMRTYLLIFVSLLFSFTVISQEGYSRAKIWFKDLGLTALSNLGLAVDHGHIKNNTFIISDFSATEIGIAKAAGFQVDILIEDVKAYYVEQAYQPVVKNLACSNLISSTFTPQVPSGFQLGSMAGFYTYQEYLAVLDSMHNQFPSLISARAPVSDTLTHENRPLYFVKISNNPHVSQSKPKVLYTALHHAREPGSLSETLFFMWYVLENYGTDPEITYLVDELELFFVPMINPDGYVQNVTSDPNGGGMFRKNKNPNIGTNNPGVDLNRNYSYQWNTTGVSPNQNSEVFPGISAFSEPETQNIKKIAESWGIEFVLNAHTHGGMMLYPYGATVNDYAADNSYFAAIGEHMVAFNQYVSQKSSGLYPASGDSDDYLYHDHGIFALTPEVGHNGFWTPAAQITDDCIDMLYSNIVFAHLPLVYGLTKSVDESMFINSMSGDFNFNITRLGRKTGALTVTIEPILGISTLGNGIAFNLNREETQAGAIAYGLNPNIEYGDEVKYVLVTDNGTWQKRDTITKVYGRPTLQFYDEAITLINWEGDWGLTTEDYYSPNSSFTDSPNGNYSNYSQKFFHLKDTIDLSNSNKALVSFRAKWDIEKNYDYVQFLISTDYGGTWIPQCGNHTTLGVSGSLGGQPVEPLYDGVQNEWVLEEIDLSEYFGQKILMRFMLKSDSWVNSDGFYFDDFELMYNGGPFSKVSESDLIFFDLFPNPANESLKIAGQNILKGEVKIYNSNGQVVGSFKAEGVSKEISINTSHLKSGVYFVHLINPETASQPKRLVIVR